MARYTIASPARSRVESRNPPNGVPPPVARASAPSTASSSEPPIRISAPASNQPEPIASAAITTISRPSTVTVIAALAIGPGRLLAGALIRVEQRAAHPDERAREQPTRGAPERGEHVHVTGPTAGGAR